MLKEHEQRREVVAEMHLRRWPALTTPCSVFQIVAVVEQGEREAEQGLFAALPHEALDPAANSRHRSGVLAPGIRFSWERHSEASTLSLFVEGDRYPRPVADPAGDAAARALAWALGLPGRVVRATRIIVVPGEDAAEAMLPSLAFEPLDLVSCRIGCAGEAAARIWSDFRLRDSGFGLVLVAANGMDGAELGRTIQRLQELGNYRNLALLGLPVARRGWKVLDTIEHRLGEMTARVAREDVTDDALLEEVTRLSIELATEATASDYRMSATQAYAKIVDERLEDLCIRPCAGHQSLLDFTRRRLHPAVRTCAAHRRRSEQLAQRTAQFVSLFRTRIETRIENQNARLLSSMEHSAARQVRLQQLVEGFSVVALTYYSVSLVAHVLEGIAETSHAFHTGPVVAVLTPVVAIGMWLTIHKAKARILR